MTSDWMLSSGRPTSGPRKSLAELYVSKEPSHANIFSLDPLLPSSTNSGRTRGEIDSTVVHSPNHASLHPMTLQQPYTSMAYGQQHQQQQHHQRSGAWQEYDSPQGQRPPPSTTQNLDYPQHEDPTAEFEKMFHKECKFKRKAPSVPLTVRSAPNQGS